ncbi:tetratricopeptide repeat-containing sensor histidine kinase [Aquiflexum lacus]|uniref:tetratricopeptide repeat-containing sensor histidine kinase n=1 Tax=Aquiflexum lacus TaxID=2483805 RepID=UPI00189491E6|nr:tetratricopeptide repeat-containing sensor histidine kinase [Aquiflexum lacus]
MKKTFLSTLFSTFLLFGAFGQKSISDSIQTKINILNLTENQDQQETAILQKDLGMAYYQENELYNSFEAFEKAAHMFKNLQDTNKESECLHMMGNVSYFLGHYNDAIQLFEEALIFREKVDDKKGVASGYNNIANVYNKLGDYKKAILNYEKSLEIKESIDDQKGIASSLKNIATIYYYQANYAPALEANLKALRISEYLSDSMGIAFVYNNMALIYEKQEKLEESLSFFQKSLTIKESLGDKRGISTTLHNIAKLYEYQEKFDLAIDLILQSLSISEELNEIDGISASLNNLANVYELQGNYQAALKNYYKSLEMDSQTENKRGILLSVTNLAKIHLRLGELELASQLAKKGIAIGKELGSKEEIQLCHITLSQIFEKQRNFENALYHFQQSTAYADSLNRQELERKTAKLEAEYEYDKRLTLIQAEQKATDLENEKILQQEKFLRNILVFAFISILIIALITLGNYFKQKKAKELLESRTAELEKANEVKSKLFSIIGHDLRNPIGSLYMLLGLYNRKMMDEDEFRSTVPSLYKNVGAIMNVLDNLLRWSIGEMKMVKSNPLAVNLHEKVSAILDFFSTLCRQKNIAIISEIDPIYSVLVDPNHLDLILRNLINNGIKFSNNGGIITLNAYEDDDLLIISVKDTGIGIKPEDVEKLFQKDLVESKRGTKGEQGTGLGLNLCQLYVVENGGNIWVKSEPGKGSTFFFSLPMVIKKDALSVS